MQLNPNQSLKLGSFSAEKRTVQDVCLASINQLKHLVLIFRTRYSCASNTFLWHKALLYVANDCVSSHDTSLGNQTIKEDVEMTDTNSDVASRIIWFMACIDGYKALAPQFSIAGGIIQGLLSMGIEKGLITAAEGRALMDEVKVDAARTSQTPVSHLESPWMRAQNASAGSEPLEGQDQFIVDLNGAMANPNAASIEALSQRFNEVVMVEEVLASEHTTSPPL